MRALLLAALLPLAGCPAPAQVDDGAETPPQAFPPVRTAEPAERSPEVDAARARWDAAGMDSYTLTLRRSCFCPAPDDTGPFEVTVRDGAVALVTLDGVRVDAERGETVEGLFAQIEGAYDQGAVVVDVAFDERWGYPTRIQIDESYQIADEEVGYAVSDVRPAR